MIVRRRSRGVRAVNPVTKIETLRWANAPEAHLAGMPRILNVPADVFDLRDRKYQPTLAPLPDHLPHVRGRMKIPIRSQDREGACTGFPMAAVVNRLMAEREKRFDASPRFLYENAKRYDEWKGAEYEGSSIRGAMKGFLKHGVCSWEDLPYEPGETYDRLPARALAGAKDRPLGAYFRVSTSSINDLQSALSEVGVVLASAQVHRGWEYPVPNARAGNGAEGRGRGRSTGGLPRIVRPRRAHPLGGHAFALVGYDREGFVIQNSWGTAWGAGGYALLPYEDWLVSRMDAWVCQLGTGSVQPEVDRRVAAGVFTAIRVSESSIQGHYLAVRNGVMDDSAPFRSGHEDLLDIARRVVAFARRRGTARNPAPLLLYAHSGLAGEKEATAYILDAKTRFLGRGIYPLHFIWHTGFWETVTDLLLGQARKVAATEGEERIEGWLRDKLIEAKDQTLELLLRPLGGPVWREMNGDASEACYGPDVIGDPPPGGSAGPVFDLLDAIRGAADRAGVSLGWHLAGHSAGATFHCRLLDWFSRNDVPVQSCSFVAPAVTCSLFRRTVMKHATLIRRFGLHTMPDRDERDDDCLEIYQKSLLYLVSWSFEKHGDHKLLGLDRHVRADEQGSTRAVDSAVKGWLVRNAELDFHRPDRSGPSLHGSFSRDPATLEAIIRRILG
jgi:hypothetical protein